MSAFLQSGRSDAPKSTKSKVRFRPEAAVRLIINLVDWDQTLQFFEPVLNGNELLVE